MSRRRAVLAMLVVTLLWSIAGVVTRRLEGTPRFEATFWRSLFLVLALTSLCAFAREPARLVRSVFPGDRAAWASGLAWGVMFTCFMVALTLTTVANVLVTMALAPFLSALLARVVLGQRAPARTVVAALVAGLGILWMVRGGLGGGEARHVEGTLVALAVPLAAAVNWTLLQHGARTRSAGAPDMRAAVWIGGALSAAAMLPFALPFQATAHDLGLLALLGALQLALPCLMAVAVAEVLSAPEVALLSLLEIVLGVAWAWLGAGEVPTPEVLLGGALVVGALVANEALALRRA